MILGLGILLLLAALAMWAALLCAQMPTRLPGAGSSASSAWETTRTWAASAA